MLKIYVLPVLGCLGVLATAHADPLTDLRATLGSLQGRDAIHAEVNVKRSSKEADGTSPKAGANATVSVRADAQGLQLVFAPKLLVQATQEAAAKAANPDLSAPINDVLEEATPTDINDLLGFAPSLLRKIDGATLKESRADTFDGKPARLIVLDLPMRVSSKERDSLKHYVGSMKIWLDGDGMPLAAERAQRYEGRKFLISFSTERHLSTRFQHVGQRLVAVAQTRHDTFTGFGQDNDTTVVSSVTVQ
ncbi:MAG: hypothetical protein ABI082_04440 [Dokdonella sp.]